MKNVNNILNEENKTIEVHKWAKRNKNKWNERNYQIKRIMKNEKMYKKHKTNA